MKAIAVLSCLLTLLAAETRAQSSSPDKLQELERKVEALSQEIEKLKLGEAAEPAAEKSIEGSAPAASKVYRAAVKKVSIGGYGEFAYQNFSKRAQNAGPAGVRDTADALRAVLYFGYKFSERILFNSELEFEHASTGEGAEERGEISVEQAYLDFRLSDPLGIRAGLVLVPVGLINEIHEPTTFHGVNRPSVERLILPSTWRENGAGIIGEKGIFSYRSYVLAGLQAVTDGRVAGFEAANGLREGRPSGSQSLAEDLAWASRLDISPLQGLKLGGSFYIGEADQGLSVHAIPLTLWDLHATAEYRGLELRGLYAQTRLGNADTVNGLQGFTDAARDSVGRKTFGGYAEAAFNVLSLSRSPQYLAPFLRYERYDTQWRTPGGFSKDPANSRVEYTLGLTYKPIPQVAVKGDHQWKRNQARTGINQLNLAVAYIF